MEIDELETNKRKQFSLDSDEEDEEVEEENYNVLDRDKIEGVEDNPIPVGADGNIEFTAFNLNEELQEGTFDKDGHYHWKKDKEEIRDNWLDNIDWVKVKSEPEKKSKKESHGLGDSDSDSDPEDILFDAIPLYKEMLEYMKPGETVSKALCRLGGDKKKMTTAERWKRKKDPKTAEEDKEKSRQITKLTELANELLTRTGNMDIYQESYEQIKKKVDISAKQCHPSKKEAELDMYADDFNDKEKTKLEEKNDSEEETEIDEKQDEIKLKGIKRKRNEIEEEENKEKSNVVTWELKWSQEEKAEIHGPHSSEQMQAWAKEGYFKKGAWVRKNGQSQFYSASRIDFELYI